MATPTSIRLDRLFAKTARPPLPDPYQPHIADTEMELKPNNKEQSWQIPDMSHHSSEALREQPRGNRDIDQMTSSDDDEYVTLFKANPAMAITPKGQKKQSRKRVLVAGDSHEHQRPTTRSTDRPRQFLPQDIGELPKTDEFGNAVTGHFCVFALLAKFPYKYMVDANDRVSRHFFANNKFYNRDWDLWCIHSPPALGTAGILLVTLQQAQGLVDEISTAFKIKMSVPSFPFTVTLFDDGTPQPLFLGKSACRDDVNTMQNSIPSAPDGYGEPPANASSALSRSWETWQQKIGEINDAKKGTKAKTKKKNTERRVQSTRDRVNQLNRAERYLGLRPRTTMVAEPDPGMSWTEQQNFQMEQAKRSGLVLEPLDISKAAPHPFHQSVVIICFDVEAWEKPPRPITEVGVSTLDTLDLVDIAPGHNGENWMKHIRSRHFRIAEFAHLRNKDFCYGDPERFLFGTSEVVRQEDVASVVDSCFEYPFSVQFKHDGAETHITVEDHDERHSLPGTQTGGQVGAGCESTASISETHSAPEVNICSLQKGPRQRNILVLGHGTDNDVEYLQTLGSKIFLPNFSTYPVPRNSAEDTVRANVLASLVEPPFDLQVLYQVLKQAPNPDNLGNILTDIGKTGWGLHNGGNDARYTLESFIGVCIRARQAWDQRQTLKKQGVQDTTEWQRETATRLEAATELAREEIIRNHEIFEEAIDLADAEDGTGLATASGHHDVHPGLWPNGADGQNGNETAVHGHADGGDASIDLPMRPKPPVRQNSSDWEL